MGELVNYLGPADGGEDDPTFAGKIRVTPDGKISIIDAIKCVLFYSPDGNLKVNGHQMASHAFSRLEKEHEEVVTFRSHFRFPGQGQRDTPVTDRPGLTRIIMLLPGKIAAKFREKMTVLLERYLNADRSLAHDILSRANAKEGLNLNEHPRIQSAHSTKELNATIKEYADKHKGCGLMYPSVHDTNNVTVTGKRTTELRAVYNATGSSRNTNTMMQSAAMMYIQMREAQKIKNADAHPVQVAKETQDIFGPIFKADGLHDSIADQECIQENSRVMRLKQKEDREAKRICA